MIPWSKGKSVVWNFTVSDTLASSHLAQTSQEAGKSAMQAEAKKLSHYQNLTSSGYLVMPVAMETLGSIGPMTMKFITDIGKRITDVTGDNQKAIYSKD